MSAVTLQEIADLVADRLRVPVASMRGLARGKPSDATVAGARLARNVVIVLARRHTQATFAGLAAFFDMALHGSIKGRLSEIVTTAEPGWLSGDPELHWAVEEIEQQIDALHERRLALRDRNEVRA
jgi:hypothetical protein